MKSRRDEIPDAARSEAGRASHPTAADAGPDDVPKTVRLFGLNIRAETVAEAIDAIDARIAGGRPALQLSVNALKVSQMARDEQFRRLAESFDVVHADGASVVWASKLLRRPLPGRVPGIDLMEGLAALAERRGYRPFLLGAKREVVDACAARLQERHPHLKLAGWRDGYWNPDDDEAVARDVRNAHPDMLFVALPSPRKELFLIHRRAELGVPFAMGVGGSFDVVAGLVRRAPPAWRRSGFEWAFRLLQEPRRLWRRYLFTNTHFVWLTIKEIFAPR